MVHLIFISALIFSIPSLNKKIPFFFFTFAILYLFLALRYDYGNDYMSYLNIHTRINEGLPSWGQTDLLFYRLNLLIPNFDAFIALTSLFYIVTIWYLIKNNLVKNQYWFAVLILLINPYLFLVHLSGIRQTLAICFFIIAISFAVKRNIVLYIIFILLATGMHASAIVLLPLYLILTEKKFNKKHVIITMITIAVLFLTPLFDIIAFKLLDYLPQHYETYYEQGAQNSLRATIISFFYVLLILLNLGKLEGRQIIYGKLSLIATIISVLAIRVSMITRIGMYFDIFLIITIPQIFNRIEKKNYKLILFFLLIGIYLLRYYSFFANPMWEKFVRYRTILGSR